MNQEISSKNTSIRGGGLGTFKKLIKERLIHQHLKVLDYGCGKYPEDAKALIESAGSTYFGYDPYNLPEAAECIHKHVEANKADIIVCNNVLNVIKEPEVRSAVIRDIKNILSWHGVAYFTVYENGNSGPKQTSKGWQEGRKLYTYEDEIREAGFSTVYIRNGMLVAMI